ncbi:MAG: gluconate 2-dehydrogenase subunit 3 family protein [Myxococcota bacterium]
MLPRTAAAGHAPVPGIAAPCGVFLSSAQLETLEALCASFVPGPPRDPDPGAREAGVHEYIDRLLGAFTARPPRIFAGGPFSHRDGGGHNAFADFIELDALEERIWRTRIEGSRGLPEREWNGPVVGLQERYTRGLARLEQHSARWFGRRFARLTGWQRGLLFRFAPSELASFLDLAFRQTLEGMYGAPEYGGNRGRVGWRYTRWPGDHQPQPYTRKEISHRDPE